MKINVPAGVTRTIGRTILQTKKNSPHIFFAVGVVSVAGSAVLACRATLKLEKTLDEIKTDIDKVRNTDLEISPQERQRLLAVKYGRGVGRVARLYGPAALLGVAGVGALTGSHVQLTRRNAAVSSALALVSQAYEDYRVKVRDEVGAEKELDIYQGVEEKTRVIDGKKTIVKISDGTPGRSPYARIFDETNPYWQDNAELNLMFLRCQQKYWNDRLQAYGHVFLNEVYEALGFDHTKYGAVVGWVVVDPRRQDPRDKDGYIDFGIYDVDNGRFVNGMEKATLLDFNVDGTMYDRI